MRFDRTARVTFTTAAADTERERDLQLVDERVVVAAMPKVTLNRPCRPNGVDCRPGSAGVTVEHNVTLVAPARSSRPPATHRSPSASSLGADVTAVLLVGDGRQVTSRRSGGGEVVTSSST